MDREASIPPPPPAPDAKGQAERPESSGALPWGPRQVLLGIVALLLIVTVETAIVAGFDPGFDSVAAKLVVQTLLSATLIGVAFTMGAPAQGLTAPALLGLRKPGPSVAKLTVTAYLAYFAFALVYSLIVNPSQKDLPRDLGYGDTVFASLVAGLLVVFVAPICEEVFFRGFVFGGFRSRFSFVWAAVLSAAIFGAAHVGGGSPTVLVQLAALGLVQAWLYERSGSIYPTIAVHMVNNAIAFTILTS